MQALPAVFEVTAKYKLKTRKVGLSFAVSADYVGVSPSVRITPTLPQPHQAF